MEIIEHHAFRLTRNADVSVQEDDGGDLLAAVELELHRRRFGQAVRLEVSAGIATDLLDMLIAEVDVPEETSTSSMSRLTSAGSGGSPTATAPTSSLRRGHR